MAVVIRHHTPAGVCCDLVIERTLSATECFYRLLDVSPRIVGVCQPDGSYRVEFPDGAFCVID